MTAPLLTRDARELRLLMRPKWQRRTVAWTVPFVAGVLIGLHTWSVGPIVCTAQDPCQPDVLGSVSVGLLIAAAIAGFVFPRLAAWLAGGFVVTLIVSERLLRPDLVSPAWLYIVDLGFVGLCALLARVSRDRRPTDGAMQWLAGVRRERPPAATDVPRPGRGWRAVGWVLALLAVACVAWGWYVQAEADAQQRAATIATAEVIAHPDEFTVEVRLAGERITISVFDMRNYPVGGRIELYVDDRGLRQPVSEPYDSSGWTFLGILLAGVGWACWARGVEKGNGPRRLFEAEQPVTEVYVLPGLGRLAVYPGDARPGEPAIFEVRTSPPVIEAVSEDEVRITGAILEPRVQPASLYGIPAPGHWCALVVNGEPVAPTRPLSARSVPAPLFGFSVPDVMTADDDATDGETGNADARWIGAAGAPSPTADLPLRPEEVEALRAADRDESPDQVRFHQRSPMVGYTIAAAMPLTAVSVARLLPDIPYTGFLLIAGVLVAASSAISWRFFMRARIAWNGHGIAVIGAIGHKRVAWRMVSGIEQDGGTVTVHTGYSDLAVGAGPVFGIFGRRDRTAEELANALRHARHAASSGGNLAAERRPAAMDDPPQVDPPRAPAGLYLLWLVCTPALAWFMQAVPPL